jgi:ligand-binding SRPBCC domain-containing protein
MDSFTFSFTVNAPLDAVARFHHDTRALTRLTPPPIVVQLHRVEPLAEGSISEFTMWIGPLPLRWRALHTHVDPLHGFTDTQTLGPMQHWQHTHTFTAEGPGVTRVHEHVEYQHRTGLRGLFTRLLFARPGLAFMFAYRRLATSRALEHAIWPATRAQQA